MQIMALHANDNPHIHAIQGANGSICRALLNGPSVSCRAVPQSLRKQRATPFITPKNH
jgi:hypothetical protein